MQTETIFFLLFGTQTPKRIRCRRHSCSKPLFAYFISCVESGGGCCYKSMGHEVNCVGDLPLKLTFLLLLLLLLERNTEIENAVESCCDYNFISFLKETIVWGERHV